jgi:hypothetical protein
MIKPITPAQRAALSLLQPPESATAYAVTGYRSWNFPNTGAPTMPSFELTTTQARRLATATAVAVYSLDEGRPDKWETTPTNCNRTKSDQKYRAELMDAYDTLMGQFYKQGLTE